MSKINLEELNEINKKIILSIFSYEKYEKTVPTNNTKTKLTRNFSFH